MHCQAKYPVKTVIQLFSATGCRQKVVMSFLPKFPLTVDSTLKPGERFHQMPGSSLKFTDQTLIPEGAVLGSKGCRTHSYSSKRSLLKPTGNKAHTNRGLLHLIPGAKGKLFIKTKKPPTPEPQRATPIAVDALVLFRLALACRYSVQWLHSVVCQRLTDI